MDAEHRRLLSRATKAEDDVQPGTRFPAWSYEFLPSLLAFAYLPTEASNSNAHPSRSALLTTL